MTYQAFEMTSMRLRICHQASNSPSHDNHKYCLRSKYIFLFCCVHNLKNKVFTFQFIWLSLCETSTPFVNVRWILHVLGRKDSALYLYNGGLLTLTFLFFRVFVYTFGLYHLYTIYPVLLHSDKPFASKFVVPTFLVVGYMLNLLWSTKILRGLISLIRKRTAKKAQ